MNIKSKKLWLSVVGVSTLSAFAFISSDFYSDSERTTQAPKVSRVQAQHNSSPAQPAASQLQSADIKKSLEKLKPLIKSSDFSADGQLNFVTFKTSPTDNSKTSVAEKAIDFLEQYGNAFGISNQAYQLHLTKQTQSHGNQHLTFEQLHQGVPVYGAAIKLHFDENSNLTAVNSSLLPNVDASTLVSVPIQSAETQAIAATLETFTDHSLHSIKAGDIDVGIPDLVLFNKGFLKGEAATDTHLAYRIETRVHNKPMLHHSVYIDAQTGKVLGSYSLVPHAVDRRVYTEDVFSDFVLAYSELDGLLDNNPEVINAVDYMGKYYDLIKTLSNGEYLSYDGQDGTLITVIESPVIFGSCPNAFSIGSFGIPGFETTQTTVYCPGLVTLDIVGHEFTHNLQRSNLILSEIFSSQQFSVIEGVPDMYGNTLDIIHFPIKNSPRDETSCSLPENYYRIGIETVITGQFEAQGSVEDRSFTAIQSVFGPALRSPANFLFDHPLTLMNDGVGVLTDGCEPTLQDFTNQIALIDRGGCSFSTKVRNAQNQGAVGVIVANNVPGSLITMAGDGTPNQPELLSVLISQTDGDQVKQALINGNTLADINIDNYQKYTSTSQRWLNGEDVLGVDDTGLEYKGAFRDNWNPGCTGVDLDRRQVNDENYSCAGFSRDNERIPQFFFTRLVDGGDIRGQSVQGIGLTKALHIIFQTDTQVLTPTFNFQTWANSLELACSQLIGKRLNRLEPLGENYNDRTNKIRIKAKDCKKLSRVIAAVKLKERSNCPEILSDSEPGELCPIGRSSRVFKENFERGAKKWTISNDSNLSLTAPDSTVQIHLRTSFNSGDPDIVSSFTGYLGDGGARESYSSNPIPESPTVFVGDACTPFPAGVLSGLVAVIDATANLCENVVAAENVQSAGAVAAILIYNSDASYNSMTNDSVRGNVVSIPAVTIALDSAPPNTLNLLFSGLFDPTITGFITFSAQNVQLTSVGNLPSWRIDRNTRVPENRTKVMYAPTTTVNFNLDACDLDSGIISNPNNFGFGDIKYLDSPVIKLPNINQLKEKAVKMAFEHYIEDIFFTNAGLVYYRVNGGTWRLVERSMFSLNGYNGITSNLSPIPNTLAFSAAFGRTIGEDSFSKWFTSQLSIPIDALSGAGNTIQFRFVYAVSNLCVNYYGWMIDNIEVSVCKSERRGKDHSDDSSYDASDDSSHQHKHHKHDKWDAHQDKYPKSID